MKNMNPQTILVVDDNVLNVHVLLESLTSAGYKTLVATRGEEALQQLEHCQPDLILLDIEMPGMNGFETCRLIKQQPSIQDIPIIFITAFAQESDKIRGFEAGAVDYITKPFQLKEVLARLETQLSRRQIQQELLERNTQLVREIVEREKAEEQLRQSTDKYMMLFEKMLDGFALHEIICDDAGNPIDYRFLDVNPEFEKLTGLKRSDIVGKTVFDVLPGTESYWIECYGQVALTGTPTHFENFSQEFDTYYEVTAFSPQKGQFACIFVDATERRRAENELQRHQEHLEVLVKERTTELELEVAERKRAEKDILGVKNFYESVLEGIINGVWVTGKDDVIYYANRGMGVIEGTITLRVMSGIETGPSKESVIRLCFEIEDTGIGIEPDKLEDIFLPFHQIGEYLSTTEGTGLGLAISSKLVEMMGGKLQVESTVGSGSLFRFALSLPLVDTIFERDGRQEHKIIGYAGRRRKILVVDDYPHNRAVLIGMLLPLGFDLLEAENGREGIEKAFKYTPDLVLLDLRMPEVDGFEACRAIHLRESLNKTIVIAVSAAVFEKTRKRAQKNGFQDFLIKPIQLDDLLDLLTTHLHIEWIYQKAAYEEQQTCSQDEEPLQGSLAQQDVARIIEFAGLGMTKELLSVLEELEQQTPENVPIIRQCRQLAKQYQFDRIKALLENQGDDHE